MRVVIAAIALASAVHAQAPRDPTDRLGWLVGGTWTASGPELGPHLKQIETRYVWSDNHTFIRFTTHFVTDSAEIHRYDGNFFWNQHRETLGVWYMNAEREIIEGPVTVHDSGFAMPFRAQDASGQDASFRVEVLRRSSDRYHWTLSENVDGGWKQLLALDYARKA